MSNVDFASFHTTYPYWLFFEYVCVSSLLECVGQKCQNKGELLLGNGRVCFAAFKYKHCLAKIA